MIRTETRYYTSNSYIDSLYVPSFSEVKKIYIVDNMIHVIIEHPDDSVDLSKLINLRVQEYRIPVSEEGYKYFDTQIITKSELYNQSSMTNFQINIINTDYTYHFFIQEIKTVQELRDNKIDNIITND